MNLVIAGGGTGGHLFPGLAVAEKLKEIIPDTEIHFIGAQNGIENKLKDDYGFKFYMIKASGYSGKSFINKTKSASGLFKASMQVREMFNKIKPDFVLGLGGYVSFMPLLFAKIKGIRSAVMEQNVNPGLSNRILGFLGTTVFASYDETRKYFPFSRFIVTGNPVRKSIMGIIPKIPDSAKNDLSIFVFGGSQGAESLNKAIISALSSLNDEIKRNLNVFHQSGEKDYKQLKNFYQSCNIKSYEVFSFAKNIEDYYDRSDIVISRAGAGTLSELMVLRKPAILVPYPFAAKDHQMKNALYLQSLGCAYLIKDNKILQKELLQTISKIFYNKELLSIMFNNLDKIVVKDSALNIVNMILNN
jgi:UDP-N-acetylglucosamine--N-acetylmuramyl-(pentapeptide) pyrophosphoryl-undecaprenol N-acetylglucosamine transferase